MQFSVCLSRSIKGFLLHLGHFKCRPHKVIKVYTRIVHEWTLITLENKKERKEKSKVFFLSPLIYRYLCALSNFFLHKNIHLLCLILQPFLVVTPKPFFFFLSFFLSFLLSFFLPFLNNKCSQWFNLKFNQITSWK